MNTIKVIYLTLIHAALAVMVFFYVSESYCIVKYDRNADINTVMDKHIKEGK